jgi:transposase
MKTYIDRLRECPIEFLKAMIKRQEAEAEIIKRDLETMKRVLAERSSSAPVLRGGTAPEMMERSVKP